jgi:hypothetical protein
MRTTFAAGFAAALALAAPARADLLDQQTPPAAQPPASATPPATTKPATGTPPATAKPATAKPAPAQPATAKPGQPAPAATPAPLSGAGMEAPKLPPFAGEIVNFDRRGTRVVACVDAAKVQLPSRPGPDGKPVPPPAPPPNAPPRLRIWVIEREVMQELLTTSGLCDPSWSPDGKSFAAAGVRGVFVFTEPNFEPRVLVAGQLQAPPPGAPPAREYDDPVWAPGGGRIAFRSSGEGGARVEVVDVKTAEVKLKRDGAAKALRFDGNATLIVDGARVPVP